MKNANTFPFTERYFAAKIIEYGNLHLVKQRLPSHSASIYATYSLEQNKLCITKILITFEPAAIPAWNFPEIFSTPVQMILNQIHVNFGKKITVTAHS